MQEVYLLLASYVPTTSNIYTYYKQHIYLLLATYVPTKELPAKAQNFP